jgi:hypothetical protein
MMSLLESPCTWVPIVTWPDDRSGIVSADVCDCTTLVCVSAEICSRTVVASYESITPVTGDTAL